MRSVPIVVCGVLVALAACAPAQPAELTDAERVALADTIRAESAGWRSAAERADAAGVLSYYADAPDAVVIRTDQSLVSVDSAKALISSGFPSVRAQTITPSDERIAVLSRDAAVESAVGGWMETDTAGTVKRQRFAFSRVWVRRDGKWSILHGYLSVQTLATPPTESTSRN